MLRFTVDDLPLNDLKLISRLGASDHRGSFSKIFCSEELNSAGFKKTVKQINHSFTSKKGSIRGLHYQVPPYSEIKIVSCIKGEIYDVAIDLRPHSSTFLQWHAETLSCENMHALLIPEGFAHGFQTLKDDCEIIYVHSEAYSLTHERGIRFDDPMIKIKWPLAVSDCSERDRSHSLLNKNSLGKILT